MPNSVINKLALDFTDTTLPKLYADPALNEGSMYLFDFLTEQGNPNADGAIAAGSSFPNLVDGGAAASLVGTSATVSNLSGKAGISMPGVGGASPTTYIDLGASYDLSGTNADFLSIIWCKTPSVGYVSPYPQILVQGPFGNEAQAQISFTTGNTGQKARFSVANAAGTQSVIELTSSVGIDAPTQYALARIGAALYLFKNGVQVLTAPYTGSGLYNASAQRAKLGAGYKGTLYRLLKENLTVSCEDSGLSGLAQATATVAADYEANSARFV